jgi:hypothetical protein
MTRQVSTDPLDLPVGRIRWRNNPLGDFYPLVVHHYLNLQPLERSFP